MIMIVDPSNTILLPTAYAIGMPIRFPIPLHDLIAKVRNVLIVLDLGLRLT